VYTAAILYYSTLILLTVAWIRINRLAYRLPARAMRLMKPLLWISLALFSLRMILFWKSMLFSSNVLNVVAIVLFPLVLIICFHLGRDSFKPRSLDFLGALRLIPIGILFLAYIPLLNLYFIFHFLTSPERLYTDSKVVVQEAPYRGFMTMPEPSMIYERKAYFILQASEYQVDCHALTDSVVNKGTEQNYEFYFYGSYQNEGDYDQTCRLSFNLMTSE